MKPVDPSGNVAEVLYLRLVEGLSVRRIARHLQRSCKAVRTILDRHQAPAKPSTPRRFLFEPDVLVMDTTLDEHPVRTNEAR